jgi:L-ascorbate metabolism protein UlaG (beta-lactamase superfamily)
MKRRRMITLLSLGGAALATGSCVALRSASGRGWRGARSDHFDGERFFNPHGPTGNTFGNLVKWQRSRATRPWPSSATNNVQPALPARVGDGEAFVTAINHCTFLIQLPGLNVLTDPVYSERVSPVSFAGPKRIRPPGLAWDALPKIDAVLVSHNHYDHLDLPTLRELHARFRPKFITGLGNRALLEGAGFTDVEELDWWQRSAASSLAASITFTSAQHWSARGLFEKNTTLWGGFWIENGRRKIYFAGDSGYGRDFTLVREKLGVPDLAVLPIGAYEPRWFMGGSHMAPDEAVRAWRDLGSPRSLAMHFDTFPLADEGFGDAERELALACAAAGLTPEQFKAPATGETVLV